MTKVVFLIGPTAVGKTELAIELAEEFDGEIVGADSRQVYRGLDIGTAKPTPAQRARVLHHLIDVADPIELFTLANYLHLARHAINNIAARGRVPFVVGGTGQYLRALLHGHQPPTVPPNPEFRQSMEALAAADGRAALRSKLEQLDPVRATSIDPHNSRRLIRALEVALASEGHEGDGIALADPFEASEALVLSLTMPRDHLYARADARIDNMVEAGWLNEVRDLLRRYGSARALPAFAALGYRQLAAHLEGDGSLEEAVQRAKFETHRFIRQQYAWFRRPDFNTRWFDVSDHASAKRELLETIESFIGSGKLSPVVYSTAISL